MTDPTELRRLAEAATPGPWTRYMGDSVRSDRVSDIAICDYATSALNLEDFPADLPDTDRAANAAYIAAMHPGTTLALLDRLARAEMLVAQCKKTLIAMKPHEGWVEDSDVARLYIKTMEALGNE